MSAQQAHPPVDAQTRADVVTASLASLIRAMRESNVSEAAAMACLRDAPDKIEAALTRGAGALVVYRLDRDGPRGIVGDQDDRLNRFADAAIAENVPLVGLNPYRIAQMALAMQPAGPSARPDFSTQHPRKDGNNERLH